ncbi:hypothetical protein MKEN_00927400 [Mycena kentingensis (nom. inval.)]|nr:hypothetical protein MKEN_00927400 [Mycena kentingensis (nom. inval.)]
MTTVEGHCAVPKSTLTTLQLEVMKSSTSLFFNGIAMMTAGLAMVFLSRRSFPGRRIVLAGVAITCLCGMLQTALQVTVTALVVGSTFGGCASNKGSVWDAHRALVARTLEAIFYFLNNFVADSLFVRRFLHCLIPFILIRALMRLYPRLLTLACQTGLAWLAPARSPDILAWALMGLGIGLHRLGVSLGDISGPSGCSGGSR